MQMSLYKHLLYSDIDTFNNTSSGKLLSQFSNDINVIKKNLSNVLVGFAKETLTLVFLTGVMFYQSFELALIGFVAFPLAVYPIMRLGKRMKKVSTKTQEELGVYTSKLDDTFQGVRIVKAYNNEKFEIKKASIVVEGIYNLYLKSARIEAAASPIMETLAGIVITAVIWYGGSQVLDGTTTSGTFFSFIAALLMAYKPMKSLSGLNNNLQEALAAIKRLYTVLDKKPKITDKKDAKKLKLKDKKDAKIEFRDVSFSYGDKAPALRNVSLVAPAGKRVALVGASGGGKSTIMNMILRFYDPAQGEVIIGKENIKDVTLSSLRKNIAIVNQEATLFDDTIRANILYGNPEASEDEMIDAACSAAAHDFIMEQQDGYDTLIGQNGLKLSGGQRQRIAIARAMIKNAPILLLDEATSSLDTVSERQVQHALDNLMQGRTTIVVAHRLSTIVNSDIIYVVDRGEIVESGTHQQLVKKGGVYAKLAKKQFSDKKS